MTDRYPSTPGHKGEAETSWAAAAGIAPETSRLRRMTLDAIRSRGAVGYTSEELADAIGVPFASAQPRTSELKAVGKLVDSGQRRLNRSGKKSVVWTLPEYGKEAANGIAS
jgi:hypothetical protein